VSVTLREKAPHVETLRSLLIEAENIVSSRPFIFLFPIIYCLEQLIELKSRRC